MTSNSPSISADAAGQALRRGVLVIDVRGPTARVRDGVLQGSIAIDKLDVVSVLQRHFDAGLRAQELVVFCTSEQGSGPVITRLLEAGYAHARQVEGGFPALARQGLALNHVPG